MLHESELAIQRLKDFKVQSSIQPPAPRSDVANKGVKISNTRRSICFL